MRTSEERTQELHRRMELRRRQQARRRFRLSCAAAGAALLVLVIAVAFAAAGLSPVLPGQAPGEAAASIFAEHDALGYVVIALLAFCLGVLFTVSCFRLRRHMEEDGDDREH